MGERLKKAAEDGDVNALYELFAQDPYLLEHIDQIPIIDTPLHISASAGKTHFAMEVMSLKPSLARKLNQNGLSPMHLALQNGHLQTVRGLITIDNELIRVKGRERFTPLHYVADIGDTDLLIEFLTSCPSSIEDLSVRFETAAHVAVRNLRCQTFKVLFGWLRRVNKEEILNWMDEDGNTVLHIATSKNLPEVMRLLVKNVNINEKNFAGLTAMDIFNCVQQQQHIEVGDQQQQHREVGDQHIEVGDQHQQRIEVGDILRHAKAKKSDELHGFNLTPTDYFSRKLSLFEKRDKYLGINGLSQRNSPSDIRNVVLLVATLIATATYQAALSPPGGYWQDDYNPPANNTNNSTATNLGGGQQPHKAGKIIMLPILLFFYTFNAAAFYTSVWVIFVVIMGLPYSTQLLFSTYFLLGAYFASLGITFPSAGKDKYAYALFAYFNYIFATVSILIPQYLFRRHMRLKHRVVILKRRLENPV